MNTLSFTPEAVEQGLLQKFLDYVMEYNKTCENGYMEVHLWSDGYSQCVDFDTINFEFDPSCRFVYLDDDHVIMQIVNFPDNSSTFVASEAEAEEVWDDWIKDHPNWKKNEFGVYVEVEDYGK